MTKKNVMLKENAVKCSSSFRTSTVSGCVARMHCATASGPQLWQQPSSSLVKTRTLHLTHPQWIHDVALNIFFLTPSWWIDADMPMFESSMASGPV